MKYIPAHTAIRFCREQEAWTQQNLADFSGVSLRTVQRLEKGVPCSAEMLMAISNAFGIADYNTLVERTVAPREDVAVPSAPPSIRISKVENAHALLALLPGHQLCNPDTPEDCLDFDALHQMARFYDEVLDLLDLLPDLSFSARIEAMQCLQETMTSLEEQGFILLAGTSKRTVSAAPSPLVFDLLHLRFVREEDCVRVPVEEFEAASVVRI